MPGDKRIEKRVERHKESIRIKRPAIELTVDVTVTASPGSAQPHTGTFISRCSAMPSANGVPSVTFA